MKNGSFKECDEENVKVWKALEWNSQSESASCPKSRQEGALDNDLIHLEDQFVKI